MEINTPTEIAQAVRDNINAEVIAIIDSGKGEGVVAWYKIIDQRQTYGNHRWVYTDFAQPMILAGSYDHPTADSAIATAVTRAGVSK